MPQLIPASWWLKRVLIALARRLVGRFIFITGKLVRASSMKFRRTPKAEMYGVAVEPASDANGRILSQTDWATSDRQWTGIMEQAVQRASSISLNDKRLRVEVLVLMDLIQDLDVVLPIVERMLKDPRFVLTVAITDWLDSVSPRVSRELISRSVSPLVVTKKDVIKGLDPDLVGINAVITACETNHPAHRVPHALVRRANSRAIPTYTLQHGLENVGLTYFEPYSDHDGPIKMDSSTILTWGPVEQLSAEVNPSMRARCFAVGTPKPSQTGWRQLPIYPKPHFVVAVFENLHWERYSDRYREAFIQDLFDAAAARPMITFLLKPHHAGKYLAKNSHRLMGAPANIVLADPSMSVWEPYTAGAIICSVDVVITTPSTVALDSARAGRAVAIIGNDMELPVYEPLQILDSAISWLSFIDEVSAASDSQQSRLTEFCSRHVIEGDAVGRILDRIAADVGPLEKTIGQGKRDCEG